MRIEHNIEIEASVEQVWELTLDVEAWPDHTPSMTSVERLDDGPLGIGSQARIKQPAQGTKVWTVTEFEPRKRFAWSTRSMGMTMTGRHELIERDSGMTNRLTIDIDGPLAGLFGLLLRRPIRSAITKENEGFKAWAEGTTAEAPSVAPQAS